MEINDYCDIVSDNVSVQYHYMDVPVLGVGRQQGKPLMDFCSHYDYCNVSDTNCPIFQKLVKR